jgi:RimJ/RimL family protein N-acetyltransferase
MEMLQQMHRFQPSIIAKDGDTIAGYVIITTKNSYEQHPLLDSLFDSIDALNYNDTPLKDVNYILVGQLCVGKAYRGTGLVQKMYNYYQQSLSKSYQYLITDVAQENPRSIKAHLKTGFEIIHTIQYGGIGWDIVLWDWRK